MHRLNRSYRYSWRDGNRAELLIDAGAFFPAMLKAILSARSHLLLEIYLFESGTVADRFIQAFAEVAQRGVAVHLLLDAYGALYLNRRDRMILHRSGVHLSYYNPMQYGALRRNLFRDHRKLLVVDGHEAFMGGAGITDAFDPPDLGSRPWHEVMVRLQGPCVLDWQHLFEQTWNLWATPAVTFTTTPPAPQPGGHPGRVTINAPTRMEIKRSLLKRLRSAERRIWIATAYFIPSRKIRRALRRAARLGTDVRLLLPGPYTDHPAVRHAGRRYYDRLLRNGVRIFEYQPSFLHAKVILCDDWVSIGSSNIDRWNFRWNLEANQEIEGREFALRVQSMLEHDFEHSLEFHYEHWGQRPWHRRLQEWFWGKVDLLLDRYVGRNKRGP